MFLLLADGLNAMTSPQQTRCLVADRVPAVLGLIPAWGVPGLVDGWYHRRTGSNVPTTAALEESLIHSLMLAESGLPVLLDLLVAESTRRGL